MKRHTTFKMIKTVCWIGVLADALWTIALAWPRLYGILSGRPVPEMDLSIRLVFAVAASLMAGWTVLLAWTARKPVERRAVLLFTAFPVLTGLMAAAFTGYFYGGTEQFWIPLKTVVLFSATVWSYHSANCIARETAREITD